MSRNRGFSAALEDFNKEVIKAAKGKKKRRDGFPVFHDELYTDLATTFQAKSNTSGGV